MVKYLDFGVEDVKRLAKVADIGDNKKTLLYNAACIADDIKELDAELEQVNDRLKKFDWSTYKRDTDRRVEIRMAISEKQEVLDAVIDALGLEKDYFNKSHATRGRNLDLDVMFALDDESIPAGFGRELRKVLGDITSKEVFTAVVREAAINDILALNGESISSRGATVAYDKILVANRDKLPAELFEILPSGFEYRFERMVNNIFSSNKNLFGAEGIEMKKTNNSKGAYVYYAK